MFLLRTFVILEIANAMISKKVFLCHSEDTQQTMDKMRTLSEAFLYLAEL